MKQHPQSTYPAPPGWRVTDDPLRIGIIGWARLSNQAREGSGYNLSASELASGLSLTGHKVFGLASGVRYSIVPGVRLRPGKVWRGIECSEVVNSPQVAPSITNFSNAPRDVSVPSVTRVVIRWLEANRIQVVHIHSLEGYGFDLIDAIESSGRPVVATLHNYWFVCPQVDLFYNEKGVCTDYEGGQRCLSCVRKRPAGQERLKRIVFQSVWSLGGPRVAQAVKAGAKNIVERTRSAPASNGNGRPVRPPDPELASGFDVSDDPYDGCIEHLPPVPGIELPSPDLMPMDENERILGADHHLTVLNDYGKRRQGGAEALSGASLVTPPSDFLRRVHVAMGVDESKTRTVRLGQPHFDQLNRRARRTPYYRSRPWTAESPGPLRIGFFGTTRANKGFEVFVRAVEALEGDVRRRCQFQLHVMGWDTPYKRRLARFPEVSYMGGYDLIQLIGAGGEYHVGVLSHVWLENSPLVLLEHLHAGKFVISSRLGGPPEWIVQPGESDEHPLGNGLMFAGGDHAGLAASIARIVRGDVILPSSAEVHATTGNLQSYPGHIEEVESIYRELLAERA